MQLFLQFMNAIEDDARIGSTHITIYMVLLYQYEHCQRNPLTIKRDLIMWRAKIHSRHTYNVCMNQLHEYGYIKYHPSSCASEGSQVYLIID
jgi:hypothetical protein